MTEPDATFQEQVAALRRAQIVDAATRVFAERGFHRATIRDVARAAGVADGTIYNYFANKTALLFAILDRLNETERRESDLAQSGALDLRAFFAGYMRQRLAALTERNNDVFQVVLAEVLTDPALRREYLERIITPTFALAEAQFARLAEAGIIRPVDIPLTVRALSAAVLGLLTLRILGDAELRGRWDDLPELLTTLLLDGLLPSEGA